MSWSSALPADLKNSEVERGDPAKYGGEPPIRFIPDLKDTHEESVGTTLHNLIKIKFVNVEQNYFMSSMVVQERTPFVSFARMTSSSKRKSSRIF